MAKSKFQITNPTLSVSPSSPRRKIVNKNSHKYSDLILILPTKEFIDYYAPISLMTRDRNIYKLFLVPTYGISTPFAYLDMKRSRPAFPRGWPAFRECIYKLWVHGYLIRWQAVYDGNKKRKPTYFELWNVIESGTICYQNPNLTPLNEHSRDWATKQILSLGCTSFFSGTPLQKITRHRLRQRRRYCRNSPAKTSTQQQDKRYSKSSNDQGL